MEENIHKPGGWRERFRERFVSKNGTLLYSQYTRTPDEMEAFIEEVREEAYKQGLKDGIDNPNF